MSEGIAWCLERIDQLITQGDLIAAWRLLEAQRASHASHPGVLVATGRLLRLRGRHAEARALLERTLQEAVDDIRVLVELAYIAQNLGEREVAHAWFERAYRDDTQGAEWVQHWVALLCDLDRFELARKVATIYSERVPGNAYGWFLLGYAQQKDKRHDLALKAYEQAMQIDQAVPMLRNNLAATHIALKSHGKAQSLLEQVVRDEPANVMAWTNLARTLLSGRDPGAAQVAVERACSLAPDYSLARQICSYVYKELQDWDGALQFAQRALELEPGNASYVWGLAMLQLQRGDYFAGWPNYEARWISPELEGAWPSFPAPCWTGQSLNSKTLVVWCEQGFGDILQFVRFLPLIAERVRGMGGKLVFCCVPALLTLVQRSLRDEVETIVANDQPISWEGVDYHLPLGSLPLMLGVTQDQLTLNTPYLKADPVKVDAWRSRFARRARSLRVGLVWSGNRTHQRNPSRSVDPLAFARTFGAVQGVEFVSVQIGASSEINSMRAAGLKLADPTPKLASFDDTAALLQNLDLVITVCTSVAHLAGALGVPTWVLLDVSPHWIWLTGRSDSPWYPSIRLYRQREYGEWAPVLARVSRDLSGLAAARKRSGSTPGRLSTTQAYEAVFLSSFQAHQAGRVQEAEAGYRRVLADEPSHADALHLLGVIHAGRGQLSEAEELIRRAIIISPGAVYLSNLGDVLVRLGLFAEAEGVLRRGIELSQDYVPAHYSLGMLLMQLGRRSDAEYAFRQVLLRDPDSNDALNNLGILLDETGRKDEAEAAYRRAIGNNPDYFRAHRNLGLHTLRAGRFGESEQILRHALTIDPQDADVGGGLSVALRELGRYDEAEVICREVLQQHTDCADAQWNLAWLLLSQGRYAEGWSHAEARRRLGTADRTPASHLSYPQWRGELLTGKSLVLLHERGPGDLIQFARYAPLLKARGLRRLTLLCPASLKALMETLEGVDEVVCTANAVGPHDFWSLTMSVPLHVGTTVATLPANLPYLYALPERVEQWRTRLPTCGSKVGIVWKGSPEHQQNADRSLPNLQLLAPLWSVPGVTFVNLQKEEGEDHPAGFADTLPMVSIARDLTDFADTAAVVSQLDLVISVDTSVAHLAGALGKPCWLLLNKSWTDWRWMHDRTDSPWYPQVMRLFRQATPNDWAEVAERVAAALEGWVNNRMADRST